MEAPAVARLARDRALFILDAYFDSEKCRKAVDAAKIAKK
jgi:hypothetical protein